MSDQPLWIERQGGSLPLTATGFSKLMELALSACKSDRLFEEAFGIYDKYGVPSKPALHAPAERYFALRLGDPWGASVLRNPTIVTFQSDDEVFTFLELVHREGVSYPTEPGVWPSEGYIKDEGQRRFRAHMNPALARRDPPLELTERGVIEERVAEPFRRLVEQPLPADAPKRQVTDRVADAIAHFKRRGATVGDRRAATRELADVLEFVRADVKVHMLKRDEGDLFRLANEFALRHNKPTTRRDFDEAVWLSWTFYVYLATIRLVLELRARSSVDGSG